MKRKDILKAFENLLINSNVDPDSKVWKDAIQALIAINLQEIED